jgi:hypothetical protein
MEKKPRPSRILKMLSPKYFAIVLLIGSVLFGIVLTGAFTDHYHLLHFAAHFGMSFLVSNFIFRLCQLRFSMTNRNSFKVVFIVILVLGVIYKLCEIYLFYGMRNFPFFTALSITGFYASISENIAGMLAAFALVIYFDSLIPIWKATKRIKSFLTHSKSTNQRTG